MSGASILPQPTLVVKFSAGVGVVRGGDDDNSDDGGGSTDTSTSYNVSSIARFTRLLLPPVLVVSLHSTATVSMSVVAAIKITTATHNNVMKLR